MDSGVDGQLYSSDCTSPFTSTSSMDSLSTAEGSPKKHQPLPRKNSLKSRDVSHKRPLSSCGGSSSLKEMLSTNSGTLEMSQAKRIKCEADASNRNVLLNSLTSASPQLLQQLMAPTKSQTKGRAHHQRKAEANSGDQGSNSTSSNRGGHSSEGASNKKNGFVTEHQQQMLKQQANSAPSNSVLMNLLVSGCDVSAGYMCLSPMRPRKTAKV